MDLFRKPEEQRWKTEVMKLSSDFGLRSSD